MFIYKYLDLNQTSEHRPNHYSIDIFNRNRPSKTNITRMEYPISTKNTLTKPNLKGSRSIFDQSTVERNLQNNESFNNFWPSLEESTSAEVKNLNASTIIEKHRLGSRQIKLRMNIDQLMKSSIKQTPKKRQSSFSYKYDLNQKIESIDRIQEQKKIIHTQPKEDTSEEFLDILPIESQNLRKESFVEQKVSEVDQNYKLPSMSIKIEENPKENVLLLQANENSEIRKTNRQSRFPMASKLFLQQKNLPQYVRKDLNFVETVYYYPDDGNHFAFRFKLQSKINQEKNGITTYHAVDYKLGREVYLKVYERNQSLMTLAYNEIQFMTVLQQKVQLQDLLYIRKENSRIKFFDTFRLYDFQVESGKKIKGLYIYSSQLKGLIKKVVIFSFAFTFNSQDSYSLGQYKIIHGDLKPENVVFLNPETLALKLTGFMYSGFDDNHEYQYIQSKCYQAPEVVLGMDYTRAVDIWSLGCLLIDMINGEPMFKGEDEYETIQIFFEVLGQPDQDLVKQYPKRDAHFHEDGSPIKRPNSNGKIRIPGSRSLWRNIRSKDRLLIEFIVKCLVWKPEKRMTTYECLTHPWILDNLPPEKRQIHLQLAKQNKSQALIRTKNIMKANTTNFSLKSQSKSPSKISTFYRGFSSQKPR